MLVGSGDKVHVVERRLFDGDVRRHFLGIVEAANDVAMRVSGFSFVYDPGSTNFVRRSDSRVRIIPLVGSAHIINVLPTAASLPEARYQTDDHDHLVLTDGETFSLDINEFGPHR